MQSAPPRTEAPADVLPWDSEFFGRRIARVRSSRLDPAAHERLIEWASAARVQWLYFLSDPADPATLEVASGAGYRLVDIRVTLERTLTAAGGRPEPAPDGLCVRRADEADIPALEQLASGLHTDSRFFNDPGVPAGRAAELYRTWIRRSVTGEFASDVVVAETAGRVCAYGTGRLDAHGRGSIGLLGVAPGARGSGIGGLLVSALVQRLADQGVRRVEVVTQGSNVAAQRLYQRNGFLTSSVKLWYHIWLQ